MSGKAGLTVSERLTLCSIGIIIAGVSCLIHLVLWGFMLESRPSVNSLESYLMSKGYIYFCTFIALHCVFRSILGKTLIKSDIIVFIPPLTTLFLFLRLQGYI